MYYYIYYFRFPASISPGSYPASILSVASYSILYFCFRLVFFYRFRFLFSFIFLVIIFALHFLHFLSQLPTFVRFR